MSITARSSSPSEAGSGSAMHNTQPQPQPQSQPQSQPLSQAESRTATRIYPATESDVDALQQSFVLLSTMGTTTSRSTGLRVPEGGGGTSRIRNNSSTSSTSSATTATSTSSGSSRGSVYSTNGGHQHRNQPSPCRRADGRTERAKVEYEEDWEVVYPDD
ncbi:hypothetical protein FRB91_004174 [Serendipita sp. 411]|nr:hypothetical protein FRB91_004174 [Serendipita sp. 411]